MFTEPETFAIMLFMIFMIVLQLYMVGRNMLVEIVCFMVMLLATPTLLQGFDTLYFIPLAFVMLSGVTFVYSVIPHN